MRRPYPPRHQYSWGPIALMAVVAIAMTVAQHQAHSAGRLSLPERVAHAAVWPVQSALVRGGELTESVATAAWRGRALVRENQELRRRVAELEAEKLWMKTYYHENRDLKRKLGWDGLSSPDWTAARVIDWASGPHRKRITIEANRELETGNIVKTDAGLVGRVIEAEGQRGQVVLLTDPQSAVAAKILRADGDHGMVYPAPEAARGEQVLMLSKLRPGAHVQVGDTVISSGLGGVYPKGLPIGVVERVQSSPTNPLTIVAYLRPYADFDHLNFVRVARKGKQG
ncbi:MAG: rod shape-determining protein MreC [Armatimonadota bacterium]